MTSVSRNRRWQTHNLISDINMYYNMMEYRLEYDSSSESQASVRHVDRIYLNRSPATRITGRSHLLLGK